MGLLSELKRRNVIRVAGLYLVGAWLATQVASTVLPMFGAPEWLPRSVVILLAIGIVPTLIFSWVYELTPEGLKRDADVPLAQSIGRETGRRIDRAIILVLTCALLYFAVDKFVLTPQREARQATVNVSNPAASPVATAAHALPTDASIAVLPFVNMSSDKEQEYFSDGLSEELLNQLAQVPQLRVIARTSSFSFKGKEVDVATIAKTLEVANLLEGSVRKSGSSLRITAQLIRAADSSHLWSKTYDREMTDIFKVQDEIAAEVVSALKLTLLPERKPASASRTGNIEAYNHYLRGLQLAALADLEDYRRAIDEFQKAIDLDPAYVSAYANQAAALVYVSDITADPVAVARAQHAVDEALSLAPGDTEVLAVRGWMRAFLWDWTGARADFETVLAANANDASTLSRYSWLLAAFGRLPEAIDLVRKAVALDPFSDRAAVNLAVYLNAIGRWAEARDVVGRRLEVSAKDDLALLIDGEALILAGKPEEALRSVRKASTGTRLTVTAMAEHMLGHERESEQALDELQRDYGAGFAFQAAEAHAWRGEKDAAFEWLERAYAQRDGGMALIKYDPFIVSLRPDPRHAAMVRRIGLPE
jgi:serine/threonine-protein kinase